MQLEATPGDEELIASLMRAAHSLKGAARIVGIDLAVEVAHAMEDAMVAVQKGERVITANRIDQLLAAADLLAQLTELEESGIDDWTMANVAAADSIATDLRNAVNDSAIASGSSPVDMDPDETSRPPSPPDDGSVQVTSHRLDQIMRLAGESLIASRRFQSVRNQLMQIRRRHGQMQSHLREARIRDADSSEAALESARKEASRTELELAEHQYQLEIFLGRLEVVADSLYDEVLGSKMRPFDEGIAMFPRLVRDLSRSLGKKATLHIEGADVPVDRDVLRELEAPLTHMLRNCVDHGIEAAEQRLAAGKDGTARIELSAMHRSGRLEIHVRDDGRGIDPERIRRKVIERGLASDEVAEALTNRELYEFLFLPGFSTTDSVTDVSGRGVGLDVVQTMIKDLSGGVRIDSTPGTGTVFRLTLPLTRSVVRALIADLGGESYAFPLTHINQIVKTVQPDLVQVDTRRAIRIEEDTVELLDSGSILELNPIRLEHDVHAVIAGSD